MSGWSLCRQQAALAFRYDPAAGEVPAMARRSADGYHYVEAFEGDRRLHQGDVIVCTWNVIHVYPAQVFEDLFEPSVLKTRTADRDYDRIEDPRQRASDFYTLPKD